MRWCGTDGNEMVWDGGLGPFLVLTRWEFLIVALSEAPVSPCGTGVGFTEGSFRRHLRVTYKECLVVGEVNHKTISICMFYYYYEIIALSLYLLRF